MARKNLHSVGTAVKVLTSVVLGASMLAGTYGIVKTGVIPTTEAKVSSMYEVSDVITTGGSVSDDIQVQYEMLDGAGQTYTAGQATPLSFRSSAPMSTFKSVEVDGATVDPSNYTVTEGSTVVTFTPEYSEALSEGEHTVAILSEGGSATATFTAIPSALNHSGTIPEGGTYTATNGTVYNAGDTMPAASEGDYYNYGDYRYKKLAISAVSMLEQLGYSSVSDFKAHCSEITGLTWEQFVEHYGSEEAATSALTSTVDNGWSVNINTSVTDKYQSEYGEILYYINGSPIRNMASTFYCCEQLVVAPTIPSTVYCMSNTFSFCKLLVDAPSIPSSVTVMNCAFKNCRALVNPPDMSNATNVIDMEQTFYNCTSLVTAPNLSNVKSMTNMKNTFYDCTSLVSAPKIPKGVNNIDCIFVNCKLLKTYAGSTDADGDFSNYVIPNSVRNMDCAFLNCISLTKSPVLSNGVISMSSTFSGCTSLTNAPTIPNSVTTMGWIFSGCTALTGNIEINANPTNYSGCFQNTSKSITITGSCSDATKAALAGTATNGNVTY